MDVWTRLESGSSPSGSGLVYHFFVCLSQEFRAHVLLHLPRGLPFSVSVGSWTVINKGVLLAVVISRHKSVWDPRESECALWISDHCLAHDERE